MNYIVLSAVLCISGAYGGQNSYLPPSSAAGLTGPGGAGYDEKSTIYTPLAPAIPILSYENQPNKGDGTYSYRPPTTTGGVGYDENSTIYAPSAPAVHILSYENQLNKGDGTYSYSYLTGNGIAAQESGRVADHKSGTATQGSFSYIGPNGQTYTVTYTADANGFVPQGNHLPTPPPIPEAIQKSLAFNAANPQSEYNTGGSGSYAGPSPSYGAPSFGARPATSYSPSTGYH